MVERTHWWKFVDLAKLLLNKEQLGCTAPLGTQGKHTGITNIMVFSLFKIYGSRSGTHVGVGEIFPCVVTVNLKHKHCRSQAGLE